MPNPGATKRASNILAVLQAGFIGLAFVLPVFVQVSQKIA